MAPRAYAVCTLHRPSNTDTVESANNSLAALEALSARLPVVFPVHPRTRARLADFRLLDRALALPGLRLIEPLGYLDFLALMDQARVVFTDSGGIQEETTVLGVACLTFRDTTERPITVTEGTNHLVGLDPFDTGAAADAILAVGCERANSRDCGMARAAERILDVLTRPNRRRRTPLIQALRLACRCRENPGIHHRLPERRAAAARLLRGRRGRAMRHGWPTSGWSRRCHGFVRPVAAPSRNHLSRSTHPRFYYVPGLFKCLDGLLLFLSAMSAVWRLRRQFDFDLIDAHFGFPDGVAAVLLGYWFGRPVTVTLRGSELEMVRYRMRRIVLAWALNRADRIIAVSTELARLAVELGVSPERVRVIGNGVDLTLFQPIDRKVARRALNIPEAAPLIVAVGHLARVKGFDLVLRAMPAIASAHAGLRFVIVGGAAASSGDYPAYLSAEIARLNLSDQVTITGAVAPAQVALWLSAADLFILASEREGSPNALREALACGCPVVTQ